MRLLFLTSAFPPEAEGAATHLPELAADLQSLGHGVQVLAVVNRHEVRDTYHFRVRRISRSQVRWIRDLRILWTLIRQGRKADVIYSYDIWWQAAVASLVTGTPWIVKFTGDPVWERAVAGGRTEKDLEEFAHDPDGIAEEIQHSLTRLWIHLARRWTVSCDTLMRVLTAWGIPRDRIEVIANALPANPRVHEDATYLAQWSGQKGLRVIVAEHLVPVKGVDAVLEAVARLSDVRLVIAGDGPDMDRLKRLTRDLSLETRVLFTGKVSRQDVAGYVRECDVLVANSRLGRFNYVIPEALARGKPVLATRRGIHPDLVEHGVNGSLHSGSPEDLHDLIADLRDGRLAFNPSAGPEPLTWERQVILLRALMEPLAS